MAIEFAQGQMNAHCQAPCISGVMMMGGWGPWQATCIGEFVLKFAVDGNTREQQ